MPRTKKKQSFKSLLDKYLAIKGLDIILLLKNGEKIELEKNRKMIRNEVVFYDANNNESRISLSCIQSVDFFAA